MDYALKIWWEDLDVVRDAIRDGDPRPIEAALQRYRDRVVAAGGVCYIDAAALADAPVAQRLLAAATVATVGELFLEIGDGAEWSDEYRHGLRRLLQTRREYPALCAGGARTVLPTSDNGHVYAFLRQAEGSEMPVLVVLNFAAAAEAGEVDIGERGLLLRDLLTGEQQVAIAALPLTLPGYGYALYAIEAEIFHASHETAFA
jgi:hypothetical protein